VRGSLPPLRALLGSPAFAAAAAAAAPPPGARLRRALAYVAHTSITAQRAATAVCMGVAANDVLEVLGQRPREQFDPVEALSEAASRIPEVGACSSFQFRFRSRRLSQKSTISSIR
jgi:hypothetical protein